MHVPQLVAAGLTATALLAGATATATPAGRRDLGAVAAAAHQWIPAPSLDRITAAAAAVMPVTALGPTLDRIAGAAASYAAPLRFTPMVIFSFTLAAG